MKKSRMLRIVILASLALSPMFLKNFFYRNFFGYKIGRSSRIGVVFLDAEIVDIDENAVIGHFTVIRNVRRLSLASDARIGTFNWIYGMNSNTEHFKQFPNRRSDLLLRNGASITSRHIIDCTDAVSIGRFSIVAGFRSQIITHGINYKNGRQECGPVTIGDACMIGTNSTILKNVKISNCSILAAGSVLNRSVSEEFVLISGVPAKVCGQLDLDGTFFRRNHSRIE